MTSVIFGRSMFTCRFDKWENNDNSWHFKIEHRLRETSSLFGTQRCGQEEKKFNNTYFHCCVTRRSVLSATIFTVSKLDGVITFTILQVVKVLF